MQPQAETKNPRRRRGGGGGQQARGVSDQTQVTQPPQGQGATTGKQSPPQPRPQTAPAARQTNTAQGPAAPPARQSQQQQTQTQAPSAQPQQQQSSRRGRGLGAQSDANATTVAAAAGTAPTAGRNNENERPRPNRGRDRRGDAPAPTAAAPTAAAVVDEYGNPVAQGSRKGRGGKGRGAKNTEVFVPSHAPPAMRVVVDPHPTQCQLRLTTLDVTLHPCAFAQPGDASLYERLVSEIEACTIPQERMLKSWHGDSHWIADDQTGWKKQVPTFTHVIERLQRYFSNDKQKFKINATRLNWYKDCEEWKPFHHDAAAVKPDIARIQNFTVAVSFGATREAAFEEVGSKKIISFVVPDGSVYTFTRDINITWKHGIIQPKPGTHQHHLAQGGRISIIAWGWLDQDEM